MRKPPESVWEFVPFGVAGWWLILWLVVAVCEYVWPLGAPSATRGFVPIMTTLPLVAERPTVDDMGGKAILQTVGL